jgi:Flp pilus assembly pilin Flp
LIAAAIIRKEKITMTDFNRNRRIPGSRSGQSLVEYALILALIAVVAILVLQGIGVSANNKLANVNGNMQ